MYLLREFPISFLPYANITYSSNFMKFQRLGQQDSSVTDTILNNNFAQKPTVRSL